MAESLFERARFRVSGDQALIIEYGDGIDLTVNEKVRAMTEMIKGHGPDGVETIVPAYRSLSIVYDPIKISPLALLVRLWELEGELDRADIPVPRMVEIPVCYGGEFGPDIQFVAEHNYLTVDQVIAIHSHTPYHIYAIGFAPGFCYLGGLDKRLHTPRLETPRTLVRAGSVGIAEAQTGVYPLESPGGWRLIGRTALKLFDPQRPNPFLYKAGDSIKFTAISREEFERISQGEAV